MLSNVDVAVVKKPILIALQKKCSFQFARFFPKDLRLCVDYVLFKLFLFVSEKHIYYNTKQMYHCVHCSHIVAFEIAAIPTSE